MIFEIKIRFFRKMFRIIALLILIFFTATNCLNKDDFCFQNENKICTGKYDESSLKYSEDCEKLTCKKPLSYDCFNYCTMNKAYCMVILLMKGQTILNDSFENCSITQLKSSDFCLNGENCFLNVILGKNNFTNLMECKCPDDKSFICGKYCTKNSIICNALNKSKIIDSESCDNGNSIYYFKKIPKKYQMRF